MSVTPSRRACSTHTFGFQIEQVRDLTTGSRDEAAYLLTQGNIRLLLVSGLTPDHPASKEASLYGDGVKDIAFSVDDAEAAYERAISNGGKSAYEPYTLSDEFGSVTYAGIQSYGRAIHSFVSRTGDYDLARIKKASMAYEPVSLPKFRNIGEHALNTFNRKNPAG